MGKTGKVRGVRGEGRAENSVVVAEGHLQHNGSFKVNAMGLPPVESRQDSLLAAKVRLRPLHSTLATTHNYSLSLSIWGPVAAVPCEVLEQ